MSTDSNSNELNSDDWRKRTPLGVVGCADTDCRQDLHAFRLKKTPKGQSYRHGTCIACDFDKIEWPRLDRQNIQDVNYTVKALKYEKFRYYYWGNVIAESVTSRAVALGLNELGRRSRNRIERDVGPAMEDTYRGGVVSWGKDIIDYARHGTATCCRRCIEEWHGVHRDSELSSRAVSYFAELILHYTKQRVPTLQS